MLMDTGRNSSPHSCSQNIALESCTWVSWINCILEKFSLDLLYKIPERIILKFESSSVDFAIVVKVHIFICT